jgi:hypothetical protein
MPRHDWRDFAARSRKDRPAGSHRKTRGDMMADKDLPLDSRQWWVTLAGTEMFLPTCKVGGLSCVWKGGYTYVGERNPTTNLIMMTGRKGR